MRLFAEIPKPKAIVAIDRLDHIGSGVELHAHLPEVVAKQTTDLPADGNVVEAIVLRGEKCPAFFYEAVGVGVLRIE